jgi:hypothetical protein
MKKNYKILFAKAKAAFRKGTVGILCIVMTALFIMSAGCTKKEKENEPIEIPFTEYSLGETDCSWQNLNHDNKVIIINSKTELEKYVICTEGTFPEIDFSKHTLLFASGSTVYGIQYLSQKFLFTKNSYILEIEITLNDATVVELWMSALIIDKLNDENNAALNVIIIKN